MEHFESCDFRTSMVLMVIMEWVASITLNVVDYEYIHLVINIDYLHLLWHENGTMVWVLFLKR